MRSLWIEGCIGVGKWRWIGCIGIVAGRMVVGRLVGMSDRLLGIVVVVGGMSVLPLSLVEGMSAVGLSLLGDMTVLPLSLVEGTFEIVVVVALLFGFVELPSDLLLLALRPPRWLCSHPSTSTGTDRPTCSTCH